MRLVHTSALVAFALVGCVSQADTTPEYGGEYAGVSTGPGGEYGEYNESSWVGPPGGAIDPGYGYEDPSLAGDPNAMYGSADEGQPDGASTTDPASTGDTGVWTGATAQVTDAEIDMTLDAYGEWVEDEDYGRVWRPYTTVVGADFTPYESCGSWVFTEYGWTFQSCDAWSWGWLPFHYGRWVYLDNSWCWSRDYTWGPAWVEWRHGGGYVGWRPQRPRIRDHRDGRSGPTIRDHRRGKHEEWRFTRSDDFGRRPIRQTPAVDVREGLRATTSVGALPIRGEHRNRVGTVMAGRLRDHQRFETRTRGTIGQSTRGYQPSRGYTNSVGTSVGARGPSRGYTNSVGATRGYNPTYNPTVVSPNANRPTWNRGSTNGYRYNPPSNNNSGYRYNPPSNNNSGYRYNPPSNNNSGYRYNPPSNRGPSNNGYRYNPPTNRGPSNNGYRYNPPTSSNSGHRYTPPTNRGSSNSGYRYNPPSRSGSSSGYRYNPPSRSSSPSSSSSRGSSRSYSAPSRGSSYSSPSRSSGGSRSSGSSRSSSSGGSRGGRHR